MLQKCRYLIIKILEATTFLMTVYLKQKQRNYKEINSFLNIELVNLSLLSHNVNIQQSCQEVYLIFNQNPYISTFIMQCVSEEFILLSGRIYHAYIHSKALGGILALFAHAHIFCYFNCTQLKCYYFVFICTMYHIYIHL